MLAALQTDSRQGEFYQQLAQALIKSFHTKEVIIGFGQRLAAFAQHAYTFRQMDNVEQASKILMNLPIAEYRNIGLYYYALAIKRRGQTTQAEALLERVADNAPIRYRGQALLSLGAFTIAKGDLKSAIPFYTESVQVASKKDLLTTVQTLKMVAVVKGMDGNHRGAVADLERLLPVVRAVSVYHPQFLYDYFNSLAVELGEVGRLEEAQNISRIALASPFIIAYPEWRETSNDIERKGYRQSRSFVPITQGVIQQNIIRLPERENISVSQGEPARILHYDWENRMVKEPNDETQIEDLEGLSENDLMVKLLYLATNKGVTEKKLRKVVAYALKVFSEPED